MNRNRKIAAASLAAGMAVVLGAGPVLAAAQGSGVSKEETVYVNAAADGEPEEITVSDWLKNSGEAPDVTDVSELEDIKNVKGEETFTQEGENLIWDTDQSDIYYQGTTNKELPVTMNITYYLDGSQISPKELAGKDGRLKMQVSYNNKVKSQTQVDGKTVEVYSPFVMVTGMFLSTEHFSNVTVENGKVVSDGDKNIVIGIAMPGLKDSLNVKKLDDKVDIPEGFTVEADVTDFSMGSTFTMGTADIWKDLDIGSIGDVDDLNKAIDKLTDASLEVVDGTKRVWDGASALDEKYQEFYKGIGTLKSGVTELKDGASSLKDGISSYTSGADTLAAGVQEYTGGVGTLSGALGQYSDGVNTLTEGVKTYVGGSTTLAGGVQTYVKGAVTLAGGIEQYVDGTGQLVNGIGNCVQGIAKETDGISQYSKGVGALSQGLKAYEGGTSQVADGVAAYTDGVSALAEDRKSVV